MAREEEMTKTDLVREQHKLTEYIEAGAVVRVTRDGRTFAYVLPAAHYRKLREGQTDG